MDYRGSIWAVSYTEQAQGIIKHLIFSGKYSPGDRLKEADLSRSLGISRSPIREAIRNLAGEGLVRLVPQRGAFVTDFEHGEIRELYELREALEVAAARLAAERADGASLERLKEILEATGDTLRESDSALYPRDLDFHLGICELAGNRRLAESIHEVNTQLQLVRLRSASEPGRAGRAYEEHLVIYRALEKGDTEAAAEAMGMHIRNGLENMMEIFDCGETGVA
jgi:DNA-binding GntR family transcriptional regulator